MVNITLVEVHMENGSFSATAHLPFSGGNQADEEETETEVDPDEKASGAGKGLALVGVLVFLVVTAALIKYLGGDGDDHEVAIETDDESVDVSIEE